MFVCFSAVVVIGMQQFTTQGPEEADLNEDTLQEESSSNSKLIGLMCATVAGVVMAFCAVTSRMLKQLPLAIIVVYHTIVGVVLTFLYIVLEAVFTGTWRFTSYTSSQWLICLAASACDAGALFGVTLAYQKDSSGFVALISYMNIVYAYFCDQVFFDEKLNGVELTAALIILFVALGVGIYKLRK